MSVHALYAKLFNSREQGMSSLSASENNAYKVSVLLQKVAKLKWSKRKIFSRRDAQTKHRIEAHYSILLIARPDTGYMYKFESRIGTAEKILIDKHSEFRFQPDPLYAALGTSHNNVMQDMLHGTNGVFERLCALTDQTYETTLQLIAPVNVQKSNEQDPEPTAWHVSDGEQRFVLENLKPAMVQQAVQNGSNGTIKLTAGDKLQCCIGIWRFDVIRGLKNVQHAVSVQSYYPLT